ncbi:MAG: hypothetical protein ACREIH_06420 [Nitrospiraceae bacterium]
MRSSNSILLIIATLLAAGCATGPAPIVIYEDAQTSVWLKFDPDSGSGHSHPASIPPEEIAKVLHGVWVIHRNVVTGFGLFSDHEGAPAFSPNLIARLTPYLCDALKKASPKDLVTFYVVTGDPQLGMLVTSGGLFVRQDRLFFILANAHTSPSSVQYTNIPEVDNRDQPLLPIARYKFTVGFSPKEAWIRNAKARGTEGYERYLDESKLLIIDMPRLFAKTDPSPAVPSSRP